MKKTIFSLLFAVVVFAWIIANHPALAADDGPSLSLSGFGTLGVAYNDRAGTEFRRDISQLTGARGQHLSTTPDSMLGVQATARSGNELEGTLQLVSRYGIDGDYRPRVAWAYLKFMPAENTSLRAGRLGIEMYMQGDAADIGYANPTIRQPIVFIPRSHDGVDAETTLPIGNGFLRLKGMFGLCDGKSSSDGTVYDESGSILRAALADYMLGDMTMRLAGGRLTLKHELAGDGTEALRAALAAAPNGQRINSALSYKDRRFDYISLAVAYDSGPWFGLASTNAIASPDWPTMYSFNTHAGYRLGKTAPYLAWYGQRTATGTIQTGIPSGLSPATDALNVGAALAQGNTRFNQEGLAVGVRREISRQMAIKLQMDHIRYKNSENVIDPIASSEPVETRHARSLNLWSAALEFVF